MCSQMVLRLDERVVGIRKISQRYPRPFSMVCADIYDVLWREASPLQHGKEQLQMAPRHRASELYSQVAQKTLNGLLHVVRRQSSPRPKRRRCSSWISRVCRSVHGPTGTQRHNSLGAERGRQCGLNCGDRPTGRDRFGCNSHSQTGQAMTRFGHQDDRNPPFAEADYVVVGGGSAGCVVAERLSEDPAVTVILVEAGKRDRSSYIHLPVMHHRATGPAFTWGHQTTPSPHQDGIVTPFPQAKVLGGGSSINAQVYIRGTPQDYDAWRNEFGCAGWSYDDVLPYFIRAEDNLSFANAYHGVGGPLKVSDQKITSQAHPCVARSVPAGRNSVQSRLQRRGASRMRALSGHQ